jgi:sulfite exporter TauE/SafE
VKFVLEISWTNGLKNEKVIELRRKLSSYLQLNTERVTGYFILGVGTAFYGMLLKER